MAYVVRANWRTQPGSEAVVHAALRELAPLSREEPGNLIYQVYQDPAEPLVFRLFEVYADRAAYDDHAASPHFARYALGQAIPVLTERERFFYETLDY